MRPPGRDSRHRHAPTRAHAFLELHTDTPIGPAPDLGSSDLPQLHTPPQVVLPPAPSVMAPLESPLEGSIPWRRIALAVKRNKWIVLGVTLTGTALGVLAGRWLDSNYAARATLWVDVPDIRAKDQGPIQSEQLVGAFGWVDLLQSHVVLDEVVRQQRLFLNNTDPADSAVLAGLHVRDEVRPGTYTLSASAGRRFTLSGESGVVQEGSLGDSVGSAVGLAWLPPAAELTPGRTVEFSVTTVGAAAASLSAQFHVSTDMLEGRVGNFMSVELRGSRPTQITTVVNAVAERFVAVAADLKREKLKELMGILGDQVSHAQANLAAAEQALRDFQVGTVAVIPGDGATTTAAANAHDPLVNDFFDMRVSREQLRRDREALQRVLATPSPQGVSTDALETIGAVQRSSALTQALHELTEKQAMLRAYAYRYTEQHPPLRRLADEVATLERETIPGLVRGLIAQLAAREEELGRQVNAAAGGLRRIPPLAIQEARLQRDVENAEQLFSGVQQRYEATRLAEVSSIPEVRILDRASRPEAPLFNAAPAVAALAFTGSFIVAVLGVVLLDRNDRRVRYPDQVTEAMGLTILGAVPHVQRRNGDGKDVAPVIEALRGLRLRVVHAHGTAGPALVTVTSPGKGDGKSFVTANLAIAFAEAGYRTLLIDGDIRCGSLHRVLRIARKPGLTELLGGTVPQAQAIKATGHASLSFLPCGSRTPSGPELLSTAPMARLITSLRPSYDAILVDSPPLAAGVDAYALGTMTGTMLLVLRAGYSNRELAEAKLDVLGNLPVRVLGAVLNDVRLGGEYRYYSYYMPGYDLDPDEPRWSDRPVLRGGD